LDPVSASAGNGNGNGGGNTGTDSGSPPNPTASPNPNPNPNPIPTPISIPLLPYQKLILGHAILLTLSFLLLLPLGALLARYLRTRTRSWFPAHFVLQSYLAFPLVLVGLALGVESVRQSGARHLDTTHKRAGLALVMVYFAQVGLGVVVHFVKPRVLSYAHAYPPSSSGRTLGYYLTYPFLRPGRRPIQNYFHAVLGLGIIAAGFWQVRTGYATEWVAATGRDPPPVSVEVVWYVWVVVSS
jgi:hypothetical protein